MIITSLLLKNKLKPLSTIKRRQFLINCINKNYDVSLLTQQFNEISELDDEEQINNDICMMCNTSDFIKDKYQEVCNNCGYSRHLQSQLKTFEKFDYITPGENIITIEKDGKKIKVNLNKIDLWIKDADPLAIDTTKIIDNLNEIFSSRGQDIPISVQNTSIKLWYNFNTLNKKTYNKKAILASCTYFGILINEYTVSLEQLSILYNVNVVDIKIANELLKVIFKETEYYKYLTISRQSTCDINLSNEYKMYFDKIKKHLIDNNIIKEPLNNKDTAGIIYFISSKLSGKRLNKRYTLSALSKNYNVSAPTISNKTNSVSLFYNINQTLYQTI